MSKRIKPTTDTLGEPISLPKFEASKDTPLLDRSGVTPMVTAAGLVVIEAMAAELFSQEQIASTLGLSAKQFKNQLGKASENMTPVRTAWEAGHAANKSELQRLALYKARRGAMIENLFLQKVVHGARENGPAVQVDAGPRITFTLPASLSEEAYYKSLGIDGPIDTRAPELRNVSPWQALGLDKPTPQHLNTPTQHELTDETHKGGMVVIAPQNTGDSNG